MSVCAVGTIVQNCSGAAYDADYAHAPAITFEILQFYCKL